jgi:hypothetical protein
MFLSADNFYWRIARRGNVIERTSSWRELGRPEAALIGVQYAGYDGGARLGPYVVRRAGRAHWLFRGTELQNGSRFGTFGVEIDASGPASPPQTIVLADRRHLFGGRRAQMTYYRTRAGAKVVRLRRIHARRRGYPACSRTSGRSSRGRDCFAARR